jgi:Tfp pilus assembly protein PilP
MSRAATVAASLAMPMLVFAQQKPATPAPAPPEAVTYSYQVEGRRDPFVSLIGRGADPKTMTSRPSGLPGILIGEIGVKGIMKDRNGFIAMLQGPDNRTYMVRSGEKLLDGSVKVVNADGVVFSQDVNDPLSVVKQREIVKKLRPNDGGRQ